MKRIDYHEPYYPNTFYHLYNRGNNSEKIFFEEKHYHFFLKKWKEYLNGVLDVYAYCLLPNHFHFLVRTINNPNGGYEVLIENKLRRMLQSYSQSINKDVKRTGSLFQKRYKRLMVKDEKYLQWLTYYIHRNPLHHGYVTDLSLWNYSSFRVIGKGEKSDIVKTDEMISFFGDRKEFMEFHNMYKPTIEIEHLVLEE